MANSKIIERIEREIGITNLVELLAERLTPTDLQSLLLEVFGRRAEQVTPSDVLTDYESSRFAHPSNIAPERLLDWEQAAFAQLPPDFQSLALSPVCPLGTISAIADVSQNWAMSTIRNTEVISDSTNVLALEAAIRRRQFLREQPKSKTMVHLAATHRLLRTQNYQNPNAVPHFSAFGLCSAGRDEGSWQFELSTLAIHVRFYLRALRHYLGERVALRVAITDFGTADRRSLLTDQLMAPLMAEFSGVESVFDDQRTGGRDYYSELCFHVYAAHTAGHWLELADGGMVDWTQKLLSSAKERCAISGIGSERLVTEFSSGTENSRRNHRDS